MTIHISHVGQNEFKHLVIRIVYIVKCANYPSVVLYKSLLSYERSLILLLLLLIIIIIVIIKVIIIKHLFKQFIQKVENNGGKWIVSACGQCH